jgi:signal transduction histidine kinase
MLKKELEQKLDHKLDYHQNSEDLSLILEEANRCKNIVANLLNFARQGKINVTKIDMGQLLAKIIKTAKINPAYKKIEIISDKLNKECVIEGDEDQIQQVFINLVNNACEAMEESSEKCLSFKMYVEEDYLVTEIKDTGQGIQKENFGKVFTPFFTTKKIGKGTGLGLAIAYGIIKMHNGFINFQSEIGKGTTFRVKLPITINKQLVNSEIKVN